MDYVLCDYPLPLSEDQREKVNVEDWSKVEFTTYSFAQVIPSDDEPLPYFQTYTIESDGQIYKTNSRVEYVEEDGFIKPEVREDGIEKVEFTGEIIFASVLTEKDADYYLEFSALVWKGELKELNLRKYEEENNEERLKAEKALKEVVGKSLENKRSLWGKKTNPIIAFYRKCVRFLCSIFRTAFLLLVKLLWKIERLLT